MAKTPQGTTLLGKTGLDITRVGFGACAIGGGGWEMGWGPQVDDDSIAAIHRALDLGVNWIDTAAAHGFGHTERVVGRALAGLPDEQRPDVFTKASLIEGPGRTIGHSLKRDSILREAEASLKRLGSDAVDLYQIHWPLPARDIKEDCAAFAELKEPGRVRHIGVSNFSVAGRLRAVADRHATTPGAVAIAWALRNPAADGAIVGLRRPDQVDPLVRAADLRLDASDIATIEGTNP